MDIRQRLEQKHSKKNTIQIVNEICRHPEKMNELIQIFLSAPIQITQRAAWPLSYIAEKQPKLMVSHCTLLISYLKQANHNPTITRNILRAFQFMKIPEKHEGELLNRTFEFLNNPKEPIAIRVFSMTIISNLSKKYPDIIPELITSIKILLPNASAGLKSRSRKILNQISKS